MKTVSSKPAILHGFVKLFKFAPGIASLNYWLALCSRIYLYLFVLWGKHHIKMLLLAEFLFLHNAAGPILTPALMFHQRGPFPFFILDQFTQGSCPNFLNPGHHKTLLYIILCIIPSPSVCSEMYLYTLWTNILCCCFLFPSFQNCMSIYIWYQTIEKGGSQSRVEYMLVHTLLLMQFNPDLLLMPLVG